MRQRLFLIVALFFLAGTLCFGQAGALRDYIGLISIHYHPDAVAYMGKFKDAFEKRGYTNSAKSIDNYLKGLSGSGFAYVSPDGTCYILTNEHIVSQSDSLSITFEKLDGAKTTYDRLKVFYVDEEKDLALLMFDAGAKPFTQGLSFATEAIDEGIDVAAAGYPGLGNTALWQFSRGTISNAAARIPKSSDSDETFGPYIQHTAQIDPGNSGGPLLVAAQGVPAGYTVIGINTLSAFRRQATNYAIPIDQVQTFINTALSKEPINERELITKKVDGFIKGLKANKAVYGHISSFLSNGCTASNAEYAISELLDKAPRNVLEDIDRTFSNNPVKGMNAAVAWLIENSMRSKTGSMRVSLDSINSNDSGGFNVVFNVNDTLVQSEWIREYGVYRMNIYSDLATGDKSLLEEKKKKKEQDKNLVTDYDFAIMAGYAYVLDYSSAIFASLRFASPVTYGIDLFYGFGGTEYLQIGLNIGYAHPIRMKAFAITPFGELGMGYLRSKESKEDKKIANSWGGWSDDDTSGFGFSIGLTLKAGVIFTSAKVPRLFGRLFYEHNFPIIKDKNEALKHHGVIGVGVGYGL